MADNAHRSYFINAWNDYMESILTPEEYERYKVGTTDAAMPESGIQDPSATITFGEKTTGSKHFHMDFWENNDLDTIAQTRHSRSQRSDSGDANYAFADGSVHTLSYGKSLAPINLWATTPQWRTNAISF